MGGEWSTPHPGHFTFGKEPQYPMFRRLGGSQGQSGQKQKISSPLGFNPQTIWPTVSQCTNYAILVHRHKWKDNIININRVEGHGHIKFGSVKASVNEVTHPTNVREFPD